jgi:hypothetical protein
MMFVIINKKNTIMTIQQIASKTDNFIIEHIGEFLFHVCVVWIIFYCIFGLFMFFTSRSNDDIHQLPQAKISAQFTSNIQPFTKATTNLNDNEVVMYVGSNTVVENIYNRHKRIDSKINFG